MPDAAIPCPFCNALVVADTGATRIRCSRCGDFFSPSGAAVGPAGLDDDLERHREARKALSSRSLKRTLLIAGSLGLLGIAVGLIVSQSRGPKPPASSGKDSSHAAVAPIDMPGLGYLPDKVDSVIAMQFRPLLEALPEGDIREPKNALIRLGIPEDVLGSVEKLLGMPLDNIDQLVIGLKLNEGLLSSQPVLVVHTHKPFNIEQIAKRAKASPDAHGDRTYYRANASNLFGERVYWWAVNDRLLVVGMQGALLDSIPAGGRAGRDHLAPRLAERARDLLTADTVCWAVLDSEHWDAIAGLATLAGKKKEGLDNLPEVVEPLRTVVLGLRLDPTPVLTAWFDMKSSDAAEKWRSQVAKSGDEIAVGGAGSRVMLRLPANSTVTRLLQRLVGG